MRVFSVIRVSIQQFFCSHDYIWSHRSGTMLRLRCWKCDHKSKGIDLGQPRIKQRFS